MKLASLALALVALFLSACAAPTSRPVDADSAVSGLGFLTGTWTLEQPNGALIEETWSVPRGKAVLGSFRRVLGNGATPFYEFTQIVATQEGVVLRQIHVHGNFDTDPRRAKPMTLQLESLEGQRRLAQRAVAQQRRQVGVPGEVLEVLAQERPGRAVGEPHRAGDVEDDDGIAQRFEERVDGRRRLGRGGAGEGRGGHGTPG